MNRRLAAPLLAIAVAATAGCSSAATTSPHPASQSAAAEPTTQTPRITDNSGRPAVAFDPCNDLSDAQISELGFRPDTRRKTDYQAQAYTFLSCSFKSTNYLISISSGNVSFAEELTKDGGRPGVATTTINGRQALTIPGDLSCSLAMQTSYGIVILSRDTSSFGTKMSAPPCEGIEDTARMISQFMPKGT